jgi:hypothetical protein
MEQVDSTYASHLKQKLRAKESIIQIKIFEADSQVNAILNEDQHQSSEI